jgi:hypothetical protein
MRWITAGLGSAAFCLLLTVAGPGVAQPLQKSVALVDPGNKKLTGGVFTYRLAYSCSNTASPCLNAEVDDLLPAEVAFVSTAPNSPSGDVAAVLVTNNYLGSGRTRVRFTMINPLPAGHSGDLLINVLFPNGTTPDGAVATNTADGVNLEASPGTFTTPPVSVTAVAALHLILRNFLPNRPPGFPAYLDHPESYQLRIGVDATVGGTLVLTSVGPVVDTLPPGTVFNGASPAADCEPGCVGTAPATLSWASPCSVPVVNDNGCTILVNVAFPSTTFASGATLTNSFTVAGTPLGQAARNLGSLALNHLVVPFAPNGGGFSKFHNPFGAGNEPTLHQVFEYGLLLSHGDNNVPLDSPVVVDTLPAQLQLASVTTGKYQDVADFASGIGVRVSYEKSSVPGVFTFWGSSPNAATNVTLASPPPGLGLGEYVTRVRWEFGQIAPYHFSQFGPQVTGRIGSVDNLGNPVAVGDLIQNCATRTAAYAPNPTPVSTTVCDPFNVADLYVSLLPNKSTIDDMLAPGQSATWNLFLINDILTPPLPLDNVVVVDLLPVDLLFQSWEFDDQRSGLPAPQIFERIENFAGTGRTLLRWRWAAGSGSLQDQDVAIRLTTSIRSGAPFGPLANTMGLASHAPGVEQRCFFRSDSSVDTLDLDGDGSTTDMLCADTRTINVAPLAQLAADEQIRAACDGDFTSSSAGTLPGGDLAYRLRLQSLGTMPMQNLVLIDLLPGLGDTGVRDTTPRSSQWTPVLSAPILAPPGTTLSYSTSANPCRGEVGGPTTACDPPNWTTVPPDPITAVRAFKVEFGSRVVQPFDELDFVFHLTAPSTLPAAGFAYNSFAYQADRADGLGSLAAEPQKVGVAAGACSGAKLGDFVWVDTNRDGIQNDGTTGVNGIPVQLYSPGPDGLRGTGDDLLLATVVTGNSPLNQPGWYSFPGLAAGSYYACATPSPTFLFTTPHVGAGNLDSDADPATGCSGVVQLAANQTAPDLDFGLVAAQLAVLGDYVWFDRNGDGLQNEPVWDGANGVTVKLFADDGNGLPEPGVDSLVATTVTANDALGRPGFYRFNGLTPGRRYFVQVGRSAGTTGFTSPNAGANDTLDSDVDANGVSPLVTLAAGELNRTLDAGLLAATGPLALGNQVFFDTNKNGIYEPQSGEAGIDGVRLDLYLDANQNGAPDPDEYQGTTFSATVNGFAGRYQFSNLAPGEYLVTVNPASFASSGPLAGLVSATGNDPAPDPDDDVDGDDNGASRVGSPIGTVIGSLPLTLTVGGEPTFEDGDPNTNLTVDFGFTAGVAPPSQPRIGLAERLVAVASDPADAPAFTLTLSLRLTNYGNVPLGNVNVTADFGAVFTAPASFTVMSVTSGDFTVNPAFDGQAVTDLLAAGNSLAVGQTKFIQVVLRVRSGGKAGPYLCSATARGTSPAGATVEDLSTDGDDPDPDGDGDPTNNNTPTVIGLPEGAVPIPTLGLWGLLALAALLGRAATRRLQRGRGE